LHRAVGGQAFSVSSRTAISSGPTVRSAATISRLVSTLLETRSPAVGVAARKLNRIPLGAGAEAGRRAPRGKSKDVPGRDSLVSVQSPKSGSAPGGLGFRTGRGDRDGTGRDKLFYRAKPGEFGPWSVLNRRGRATGSGLGTGTGLVDSLRKPGEFDAAPGRRDRDGTVWVRCPKSKV